MSEPSAYEDGYSALPAEDRRRLAGRMFAEKNYVLAAALFESVGEELSALEEGKLRYSRAHIQQGHVRLVNTAAVLPILFHGYRGETVAGVLGVKFGDSASATVDQLVQVVYQPSFDPEAVLSLVLDDDRTVLSITAASVSLWRSAYLAWDPDFANSLPAERLPEALVVHQEQVVVRAEDAVELWRKIGAISVDGAERQARALDGLRVAGCFRDGRRHDFNVHVASGGPGVQLARLLFEAAWERARLPGSVAALENLFGYLRGSGLPVKVQPGSPCILRIFGRLGWSPDAADAIREELSAIPADEPLIVDLSNFRSMGTYFHPFFAPLVQRSGPTAWIRSPGADDHLCAMSVSPACIFDTMPDALAHIRAARR
ncbi:hypothetical protein [Sorangium sp. So ce363]|uniref:hypothetical protein n=1 Tax=Sorangium sp. So ce363 TaxID=3133304 RepID=UPI003F640904